MIIPHLNVTGAAPRQRSWSGFDVVDIAWTDLCGPHPARRRTGRWLGLGQCDAC